MRLHIIRDGIVENTILADIDFAKELYSDAIIFESEEGGPGWHWDGQNVVPPPPELAPVPQSVTPLQIRKALRQQGLYDAVVAWVQSQDIEIQETWEYSSVYQRNNSLVGKAAEELGKTQDEIDELFRLAGTFV